MISFWPIKVRSDLYLTAPVIFSSLFSSVLTEYSNLVVICHGPLDRDAIGPGARKIPYMCSEIQQRTMSLMYLGLPEENVLQTHIEGIQRYCGSNAQVDTLASQYVQKLGIIIKRSTHELDLDDQASIRLWVEKNKKSVFIYQDSSDTDPFILGIQTEWQLQMMIRFGRHGLLACDSSFGISKLKVVAEFMGTFILLFMGCGSAFIDQKHNITILGIAFAWSITLMAMIYCSYISGAHFNSIS